MIQNTDLKSPLSLILHNYAYKLLCRKKKLWSCQQSWIGANGSLPPYISASWLSSMSLSKVDFSFLFSTKTICKKIWKMGNQNHVKSEEMNLRIIEQSSFKYGPKFTPASTPILYILVLTIYTHNVKPNRMVLLTMLVQYL